MKSRPMNVVLLVLRLPGQPTLLWREGTFYDAPAYLQVTCAFKCCSSKPTCLCNAHIPSSILGLKSWTFCPSRCTMKPA